MHMCVMVEGMGVGLPNKAIQLSALLRGEICLCDANHNQTLIKLSKNITANTNEGTVMKTKVITEWIDLQPQTEKWLYNPWLIAKDHNMEIEVVGGSLDTSRVDVFLRVFQNHRKKHVAEFYNVPADGSQCSSFVLRSEITVEQVGPTRRFKIPNQHGIK